jgi:hypothetical protein
VGFGPNGGGSWATKKRKKKKIDGGGATSFGPTKLYEVLNILQTDYRSLPLLVNSFTF